MRKLNAGLIIAEAISMLKQQPGKNIGVAGSPTLVGSLLQADLFDELMPMLHPLVVGRRRRLFEGEQALKRLKRVASKTTRSGVSILTCQPV